MLSILAQRAALRLPTVSSSLLLRARAAPIVLQPVVTRAFGSSPLLAFPKAATKTAEKATKTAKTTKTTEPKPKVKKPAAKKPAKKTRLVQKKKPAKKVVKKAKPSSAVKMKDGKVVIGKEHARPKNAKTAFILFYQDFWKSADRTGITLADTPKVTAAAAERWKGLPDVEKQRYIDLAAAEKAEAMQRQAEWRKSVPTKVAQEINRRRVAAGKNKISFRRGTVHTENYVLTPYAQWVKHVFAPKYREEVAGTQQGMFKAAGEAWNALPASEKQSRLEAYRREKAAKAEQQK